MSRTYPVPVVKRREDQVSQSHTKSAISSQLVPNGTEGPRKEVVEASFESPKSEVTANPPSVPTNDNQKVTRITVNDYTKQFNEFKNKTAESYIEMGRVVREAHTNLSEVKFGQFCKCIGYESNSSSIRKFMRIGEQAELLSRYLPALPSSWTSLYQLVQLDSVILESALDDGTITHDISGASIRKLVAEHNPREQGMSKDKGDMHFRYIYGKKLDTKVDEQVQRELDELIDGFFIDKKGRAAEQAL